MRRRDVLTTLGSGAALGLNLAAAAPKQPAAAGEWPFPDSAPQHQWSRLAADGFSAPVPAFVFEGTRLESGVPLGGLGTGYLTLEGNGKIGLCSIFNDLVPPKRIFADWLNVAAGTRHVPLSAARISYWGHYPVADLRAEFGEIPLRLGLRAFSPLIVGDAAASNLPVVLFDLELHNTSDQALPLVLALQFPEAPAGAEVAVRGAGIQEKNAAKGSYALEARLAPREKQRVRFALAWYAPSWRDKGSELHYNRYSQRFRNAGEAGESGLRQQDALLRRVLAWQAALYRSDLPDWLQDWLVQSFYSLAKNSVWIARTRKDEWWGEDGWFTHSESHTGCPIVETMVCRIHGHFPLLFFFPELEATTLEAFRHFQIADGEVPFCFGQNTSMRDPRYHCQHPLNSGQYAQMIHRLYLRTGDRKQLLHFYDSAKRAIRYQYSLDDDGSGLVHEQAHVRPGEAWPANQFYDVWPWEGVSSYVAGTWLATLAAGKALADLAGDREFSAECSSRLARAQRSFEERLWNGSYYRLWSNAEKHSNSEVCLANQLMGEWCAKTLGLPAVLPAERIASALGAVERLNLRATSYGLVNGVTADGKPYDTRIHPAGDFGMNIFVGENLCAAATLIYHGRREAGLEVARRLYEAMAVKTRSPWNQRCLLFGDSGLPLWGDDYYSNQAIWSLPMALNGQSIEAFSRAGVAREMLRAGA